MRRILNYSISFESQYGVTFVEAPVNDSLE